METGYSYKKELSFLLQQFLIQVVILPIQHFFIKAGNIKRRIRFFLQEMVFNSFFQFVKVAGMNDRGSEFPCDLRHSCQVVGDDRSTASQGFHGSQ